MSIGHPASLTRLSCSLWGHQVDNHVFEATASQSRECRCGTPYLFEDGTSTTRVRHTLSCFLGHHTYKRLIDRDGYHEYVCVQCGHPLLFRADRDPYAAATQFTKRVRYMCGLLGHRVDCVGARDGLVEYACGCGHSFLRSQGGLSRIRHPLVCVVSGHWIRFLTKRATFSEYICQNCGHPFCFANPRL
jgi:DNA-directed RNA polymerase subunit RPC12/RpoP